MMDESIFDYSGEDGVEYRLVVNPRGFSLYDKKTDELLVDASMLVDTHKGLYEWPVEICVSNTNREHYFMYTPYKDDKIQFGISRRK